MREITIIFLNPLSLINIYFCLIIKLRLFLFVNLVSKFVSTESQLNLFIKIDGSPKRKSSGGGWGNKKKGGLFGYVYYSFNK